MKFWSLALLGVSLQLLCCNFAHAQAGNTTRPIVVGRPIPGIPGSTTAAKPAAEARAFGTDGQTLPGKRVTDAKDLQGKWLYRESRNNVVIDGVRVPLRATTFTLELREDGTYTLTYEVYWGAARAEPAAQQAALVAKEKGSYALSGGILLLEAEPLEVIDQGKFESQRRSVPAEKRAYIAALDGQQLNIAGPCASYQIETACASSRSVWLPLTKPLPGLRGSPTIGTRR
jgi:hypothetical protein